MSRLQEISERLKAIASQLDDPETKDETAADLTREAADLSAEAVEEANRRIRETGDE